MKSTAVVLCATSFLLTMVRPATGQQDAHANHGLGSVNFPVSCNAAAQAEFNHAVALLHHMTYPQALESFGKVATSDPTCAMAQWGIAMSLFTPLWPTRPSPQALQRGWDAVQKANAVGVPTERERLFVATMDAFFREPASTDYWLRIRRWEQASEQLYRAFPQDDEAAAFYALAHLAVTRSDTITTANADSAAAILLRVYAHNPDHPGAMHYLVHANDVNAREERSIEITRKYDSLAPENPHALHMPTHIYVRLGEWERVIDGNRRAAAAALKTPAGPQGEYVWDEYPHAVEYLIYAFLQKGEDDSARAALAALHATPRLEPTFKTAFHLVSTRARYALERGDWEQASQIVPRVPENLAWDRFGWPEATAHFARGLGAAHRNDTVAASAASARMAELEAIQQRAGEQLFARNIRIMRLELDSWIAHFEGRNAESVARMRDAVDLEAITPKHAVTPGPTIPALELLGDLLAEQKQAVGALDAYQRSLAAYPKRFNSVLGAARAARAAGNAPVAQSHYRELLALGSNSTRRRAMQEARDYLMQR